MFVLFREKGVLELPGALVGDMEFWSGTWRSGWGHGVLVM